MPHPRYLELESIFAPQREFDIDDLGDVELGIDMGDGQRLYEDLGHYRLQTKDHFRRKMDANKAQPEVYGREWKVHLSMVDTYKERLPSDQDKQQGRETLGKAWDAILPILVEHRIHAKVMASDLLGTGVVPAQGKKNITLYFDTLEDTPEKWRLVLTKIEKALRTAGLPAAGDIPGDKPVKGSQYMYFSSGKKTAMGDRVHAEDRTEEHLQGSPFDAIEIKADGPLPPYGGAGGTGMQR